MWLLDVNLPTGLLALLRGYSISCDTTANRGWRDLTNGLLAEAAFGAPSHKQRQLVVVVPEPLGVVPLDHLDRCPAVGREPLQIRALR